MKRAYTNGHKRDPKVSPRAVDPADVWADMVAEKAARAMAGWMKATVHLSRPLSSLKLDEMKALALTAIHLWIAEASHRRHVEPNPAEKQRLNSLLS